MTETLTKQKKQLTMREALTLIKSGEVYSFDCYYTVLRNGQKHNVYFSDEYDDFCAYEKKMPEFVEEVTNDTMVYLILTYRDKTQKTWKFVKKTPYKLLKVWKQECYKKA